MMEWIKQLRMDLVKCDLVNESLRIDLEEWTQSQNLRGGHVRVDLVTKFSK